MQAMKRRYKAGQEKKKKKLSKKSATAPKKADAATKKYKGAVAGGKKLLSAASNMPRKKTGTKQRTSTAKKSNSGTQLPAIKARQERLDARKKIAASKSQNAPNRRKVISDDPYGLKAQAEEQRRRMQERFGR